MTSLALPTTDKLGTVVSSDASPATIAHNWLESFKKAIGSHHFEAKDHFVKDGFWRDILSLSPDYRTIHGVSDIQQLIRPQLNNMDFSGLSLAEDVPRSPVFRKPFPDLVFLQLFFDFETRIGKGTGICRLVQSERDIWKAYTMFTCLDSLKGYPEQVGRFRPAAAYDGNTSWVEKRHKDKEFKDTDPQCLIIGGGHSGLETAARLKALNISTLVVEQTPRIGDKWRTRYRSLQLHDTIWYNQTPYMPFPTTWPIYTPAAKLGDFLESYVDCLELNVWTSSNIKDASWGPHNKTWTVKIDVEKDTRTLRVKHLIFATGFGMPKEPTIPGKDRFHGLVIHSSAFTSAKDYAGKKAVVVGAANSAHDIAQDFCNHGVDVTMYQRSSTYVLSAKSIATMLGGLYFEGGSPELADRLSASFPAAVTKLLHQRVAPGLAKTLDRELLDGLAKAGFKTNLGPDGSGVMQLLLGRAGGYYVDTGASKSIIDGTIKVKSGSAIQAFDEKGLQFEDGSRLDADIVVFATGYHDPRETVANICGPQVSDSLKPVWGLDKEGELNSVWRKSGHEGLWFAIGNLALSRFYSSALALQIKGIEEGIFPTPTNAE